MTAVSRRLMFIGSSDYDGLVAKGVVDQIAERDENGYFNRVISVHPLAKRTRKIPIAPGHDLYEFGFDALPGGSRWRPFRLAFAPIYFLIAAVKTHRLLKREHIDIIRASDPYWAALVAWLGHIGTRAVFLISIHADWNLLHGLDPIRGAPKIARSRWIAKRLERFLIQRADGVLCIRRSLTHYATSVGASAPKIRLFPHGIDLSTFLEEPEPSVDPLRVVFAGRFSKENYIDDVLAVARSLRARTDVVVEMIGGGPEFDRIQREVNADEVLRRIVELPGFLDREVVLGKRRYATVNLAPMGGYSLIESCASGNPTVAYDVDWHSELIANGQSGILVVENDTSELIAAVMQLLDDEALRKQLGAEGRRLAFERHSLTRVQAIRAEAYESFMTH